MISTVVWGTGNVGRFAVRAVDAHPALTLTGVLVHNPDKVGRDAGDPRRFGTVSWACWPPTTIAAVLAAKPQAIVYAASGDIRPDDALDDVERAIRAGAVVVTPAFVRVLRPGQRPG